TAEITSSSSLGCCALIVGLLRVETAVLPSARCSRKWGSQAPAAWFNLRAVRASILLTVLLAGATLVVAPARAAEQTIEPLTPPHEQRVEAVGGTEDLQHVGAVDETEAQRVAASEPPSPSAKAA